MNGTISLMKSFFHFQDSICSPQVGRTCCEAAAHGREGEKPFLEENFKALWWILAIGHVCLWMPLLPWKNNLQWGQKYLRCFLGVLQNYHQMEIFSLDDLGILRTTARNPAGVM